MFDLTGKITGVSFSYETRNPIITLEMNDRGSTMAMVDELKHKEKLSIKIGKYRKKRSLDANAYFHVLVNKIAAANGLSDDEAKKNLVCMYGTIERDEDGQIYGAMLPAGADIDKFYPYSRMYKTMQIEGKEYECYLFYKRTHTLDSKEMARLIDGTVQEAKELGIETLPPDELAKMEALWGK